MKNSFTSSVH